MKKKIGYNPILQISAALSRIDATTDEVERVHDVYEALAWKFPRPKGKLYLALVLSNLYVAGYKYGLKEKR